MKSSSDIKKIVIIGPESTGKSTLCEQLAKHFDTLWVPEHARAYLNENGTNYTVEDLVVIAKNQLADEDAIMAKMMADENNKTKLLFIDTDMYVMKVWSEYVFNSCDAFILHEIVNRKYDLYLLCEPDVPWVKDELREYPDLDTRNKLYHHYKDAMTQQAVPWVNISGDYELRLKKAVDAVEGMVE
jgi:NadR type nicotinamide-nucleotide adenylyltransferase